MEDDESTVVQRVLGGSLQQYLYDQLPLKKDFIIRLKNATLIDKNTAEELCALAHSGDRSCIHDLITFMWNFWDEATLNKFCTFLEKYGKGAKLGMVQVAAKIREKLKGEVNEPGPSGSKRSQLPSDDQYPQSKRPYSTTKDPTAPRAGMDEKIARSLDVLKKYREGLIDNMKSLGAVLDIKHQAKAILSRNGSIDDHLLEILDLYINEKCPTWRDFCTALNEHPCFNKVREKIEADHNSSKANELKDPGSKRSQPASVDRQPPSIRPHLAQEEQRPGVADGDEPVGALQNVRFAIVTANDNEWESATFFMGTPMDECKITNVLKQYLTKNFNFRELFETDGITVEFTGGMFKSYRYVRVCGVLGVLIQCTDTGSHGPGASEDTVTELLKTARSQKWDLQAVFLVGCCGCASQSQEKEGLLGDVLIAQQIIWYKGKFTEGKLKMKHVKHTYNIDKEWVKPLIKPNKNKELSAPLKVQNLKCTPFLSGNFVVADEKLAEDLRTEMDISVLGIEMEGAGAFEANSKKDTALHDNKRPAILVVKGVSDFANSKKNADTADTAFFNKTSTSQLQEKDFPTDEDSRQQMCTMMSLMIVFRAIKAEIVGKWY